MRNVRKSSHWTYPNDESFLSGRVYGLHVGCDLARSAMVAMDASEKARKGGVFRS